MTSNRLSPSSPPIEPRAIVADDDDCVRALVSMGLREAGFLVTQVADGRALLDWVEHWNESGVRPPAVLITDVEMPGGDGISLLPALRALLPDTPLIVMSGNVDPYREAIALRAGADAFLHKPFRLGDLRALVTALVVPNGPPASTRGLKHARRASAPDWSRES